MEMHIQKQNIDKLFLVNKCIGYLFVFKLMFIFGHEVILLQEILIGHNSYTYDKRILKRR